MRTSLLLIGGIGAVLGALALLAPSTSAGPINTIDAKYGSVTPAGRGLEDLLFDNGLWNWDVSPVPILVSDMQVTSAGSFPLIDVADPTGAARISFTNPADTAQAAIFDLNINSYWVNSPQSGVWGWGGIATLESNSLPGADLSPFDKGGVVDFSTTGVVVDPTSNTATVDPGATAEFSLTAVPEPTAAILAISGGFGGLLWLRRTRAR
jgi:hypothetical protein